MTTHDTDHDFHQFRHFDCPVNPSPSVVANMRRRVDSIARQHDLTAHLDAGSAIQSRPLHNHHREDLMPVSAIAAAAAAGTGPHAATRGISRAWGHPRQAVVSFGLVVLVLLSLIAISFNRMIDGPVNPTGDPSGMAGLVSQEGTPGVSSNCMARSEPWDASISALNPDRPARYTATRLAPAVIGNLALETYLDYMTCAVQQQTANGDQGELDRIDGILRTYQTADGCSAEVDVGPTECVLTPADPLGAEFLATAPITLNRPPQLQRIEGTRHSVLAFELGDVYEFFDGRYGVVMGSPSTAMFRDGFTATENLLGDGVLVFVAFREFDGLLYIDEFSYVFIAESQPEDAVWPSPATPAAG